MLNLQLENKLPDEVKRYEFDFLSAMAEGETLTFSTVACYIWSGTDASPSAMISGSSSISGSVVSQLIEGGIAGNIYVLVAGATTSGGQSLQLRGQVAVLPTVP